MVSKIAFFVEGEEDRKDSRDEMKLRRTFHRFFKALEDQAIRKGITLEFRMYKSRRATYEKFCQAVAAGRSDTYAVLLVDAESAVADGDGHQTSGQCWEHVKRRPADAWETPTGVDDEQCQLMVEAIEAWLFADPDALIAFYGNQGFHRSALPRTQNVEKIPKTRHLETLEAATRDTLKGRYHKVKHLSPLISRLDPEKVRQRAPYCNRIFTTLADRIEKLN